MIRPLLALELILIFIALPGALAWWRPGKIFYVALLLVALFALFKLSRQDGYRFREDWNWAAMRWDNLRPVILRFIPLALIMLLFVQAVIPQHLLSLPLQRTELWLKIMFLYPLLSVFTQEIVYRSFFFRRYARLISPDKMLWINAALFGWGHIVMHNWIAIAFSFVGSLLFAQTYRKTHALSVVCFEHALYGCYLFTIGLGFYFYHGMAGH